MITLRQISVRSATNGFIPTSHILISDGGGNGYWNSISSIANVQFDTLLDGRGSTMKSENIGSVIPFSTMGIQGLF